MAASKCKEEILDAAEQVVIEAGAAHLTLEAVAERAGLSKGGLIYHFPNKEALLEGMVARMIATIEQAHAARLSNEAAPTPEARLRAEILAHEDIQSREQCVRAAILAVMANQPHLMAPFREGFHEKFLNLIEGQPSPVHASILLLAIYGMGLLDLLGLSPIEPDQRQAIVAEMLRQTETDS